MVVVVQSCQTEEELLQTANQDVSQLSTNAVLLWQQFLEVVTLSCEVETQLCRRYHQQKTKRHAEAYFCSEQGLSQLYALPDSWHEQVAQFVRASDYYNHLPPLQIECPELDGWPDVLPIIFEDVYSPENVAPTADIADSNSPEDDVSMLSVSRVSLGSVRGNGGAVGKGKPADSTIQ